MTQSDQDIDSIRQQRTRDMLRLAQTKEQNLEETLKTLHTLQSKLAHHHDLNIELEAHSKKLFLLTKEGATLSSLADDLERFETFESIMPPFLKMQILQAEAEDARRTGKELTHQIRQSEEQVQMQEKLLTQSDDTYTEALLHHQETCATLETVNRLDGEAQSLEAWIKSLKSNIAKSRDISAAVSSTIHEVEINIRQAEESLEALKTSRHSLESHEAMLGHTEIIISHLRNLKSISQEVERLTAARASCLREQSLENETLGRIYTQYNDINQQILTLGDEVGVHRTSIRGLVSYDIQERVLSLKSRMQMLMAAKSLWRRIHSGYINIEEKTHIINTLRLNIEHDLKSEQDLAIKVKQLQRQVHEKEDSLTMSKSQDVIQLRADLREGEACTVCGATHHPFHSDTMLEQSKLISDIRSEYDTLSLELQGWQRQLEAVHDKLTQALGQQIAEQQNLDTVKQRQDEDVKEWQVFAQLDSTFHDCTPSTDAEGRMATLRQLIDNTSRDVAAAKEELGEYIYHTSQIDVLSEKITTLEERKEEISVRMNEVNTACQVLAIQVEQADSLLKNAKEQYRSQYEQISGEISIPDWYTLWQHNMDALCMSIAEMDTKWHQLNVSIPVQENIIKTHAQRRELLISHSKSIQDILDTLTSDLQSATDKYDNNRKTRSDLMGATATGQVLEATLSKMSETFKHREDNIRHMHEALIHQSNLQGQSQALRQNSEALDAKTSAQRSMVDLWIHAYNANHPPVQYAELNQLLTQDIDWSSKRNIIRQNQMDTQLEQQKVKQLESEILALEVDTGPLTLEQAKAKQAHIQQQIHEAEQAQRQTMIQIARYSLALGLE